MCSTPSDASTEKSRKHLSKPVIFVLPAPKAWFGENRLAVFVPAECAFPSVLTNGTSLWPEIKTRGSDIEGRWLTGYPIKRFDHTLYTRRIDKTLTLPLSQSDPTNHWLGFSLCFVHSGVPQPCYRIYSNTKTYRSLRVCGKWLVVNFTGDIRS